PLHRLEGLVSFYPHFRRTPPPRVSVSLCRDVSCRLAGGADFCARAREALAGEPGVEVTEVSCLGRCDSAPAAAVNEHPLCAADLDALVARAKDPPSAHSLPEPTRSPRRWASDPYAGPEDYYAVFRKAVAGPFDADAAV